ncbi:MAG: hypothetical protein AABZ34_04515 [Nitrospirota bacterium]
MNMQDMRKTIDQMVQGALVAAGAPPAAVPELTHAERVTLVAEIGQLRDQLARQQPSLEQAVTDAEGVLVAKQQEVETAWTAVQEAHRARLALAFSLDTRISKLEGELRVRASVKIDQFVETWRTLAETERHRSVKGSREIQRSILTDRTWERHFSTAPSVVRRLTAIREACCAAEALKLTALDDTELAARLKQLADGIPAKSDRLELVGEG